MDKLCDYFHWSTASGDKPEKNTDEDKDALELLPDLYHRHFDSNKLVILYTGNLMDF